MMGGDSTVHDVVYAIREHRLTIARRGSREDELVQLDLARRLVSNREPNNRKDWLSRRRSSMLLRSVCMIVILATASCATSSDPAMEAALDKIGSDAGRNAGRELAAARDCGADETATRTAAYGHSAPSVYTPTMASNYKRAFLGSYDGPRSQPSLETCSRLRNMPEYAALLTGVGPTSTATKPRAPSPARRTAGSEPAGAYCPALSLEAHLDTGMGYLVQKAQEECKAGDLIVLPVSASGAIATLCDMARSVTAAGPNVYCTLSRPRSTRLSPS